MPCSINFSITLQTEILSTETSDFLKQIIFLLSFSVYNEKAIKSEKVAPVLSAYCHRIEQSFCCQNQKIHVPLLLVAGESINTELRCMGIPCFFSPSFLLFSLFQPILY